jgi:polysaccharide biosynthesis transport protein
MSDNDTPAHGPSFHLVESGGQSLPAERRQASPPDFPVDQEDSGGMNIRRYLAAVLRYKWLILALTVGGTVAGYYATALLPEEYQAQATVWIETPSRTDRGPIGPGELLEARAWIELLRSYVVLDEVVLREGLYLTPGSQADSALFRDFTLKRAFAPGDYRLRVTDTGRQYRLTTRTGTPVEEGWVGDSIGAAIGFNWQPPAALLPPRLDIHFQVSVPREVAVRLNSELRTQMDRSGNFLRLELRKGTPDAAANILNAVLDRYLEVAADLKRSRLDERTRILEEQLSVAATNLMEAERDLQSFKVQTVVLPSEHSPVAPGLQMTQNPVYGRFFNMRVELEQLKLDRTAIERALAADHDAATLATALEAVPSVSQNSSLMAALSELTRMQVELRSLLNRFTEEHPPVQELQGNIANMQRQTIPSLGRTLLEQLERRQGVLEGQIGSAGSDLAAIPPRMIEEARLARHVGIAETLYRNLEVRVQEARLSAASAIPDVSVLDRASAPRNPVRDDRPRFILMALVGSLGLGILGAVLRERMDPSIRHPDQITDLGITVLGAVPKLGGNGKGFTGDTLTEATEAFRGIRLNLSYAHGAGPILTTISSPGPGDGKSFVSANLAVSFAELGRKTLLIDGDVRKGTAHELLGLERVPGLTDHLLGVASLRDVVRSTRFENLDIIPCGRRSRTSPELVDSTAMRRLILEARTRYDVILVDSAPLGAGIDPFVLGTLTGSMVLVFRTGRTDQDLSEAKLDVLDRLPVRMLGAIMNAIEPGMRGYGYYHYYSYLPGYEAEDETERPNQLQTT